MALIIGRSPLLTASRIEARSAHGVAGRDVSVRRSDQNCQEYRRPSPALGMGAISIRTSSERKRSPVVAASASSASSTDLTQAEATGLRRIAWVSFWSQLALSVISAIVIIFTTISAAPGEFPPISTFFNIAGVVTGFISTFLAYGRTRLTRRVLLDGEQVSKSKAAAGVLGSTRLNMIGLGSTLVGLQSIVGGLFMKTLTSASATPYNVRAASTSPAALDIFAVQASTNTILLHFCAILAANWTLRILNKDIKAPAPAT